jgi:hypothetical protein
MNKSRVAFDFDKVFVDYPPLIPGFVIDFLYKKRNHKLSYRIPGYFEQKVRIMSHAPFFRHPIKDNLAFLSDLSGQNKLDLYLISSRFSFLKKRTSEWDKKHNVSHFFKKMYFNFDDEQPHVFKDKIIKQEKIDKFVDDDLELLIYLSEKNPNVDFFWLSNYPPYKKLTKNIRQIKKLSELKDYV